MNISHIAVWTFNIETLKEFYIKYFNCRVNKKYQNKIKKFESYFLSFDSGVGLEIMNIPGLQKNFPELKTGYAHIAISAGSKEKVIEIIGKFRDDGFKIKSEPRTTGEGFFESVIFDPDGNEVEITI